MLSPASTEQISGASFPLAGALARLLTEQGEYMAMTGMAHAEYEVSRIRQHYAIHQLANLIESERQHRILPVEALQNLRARALILAGDVEAGLLTGLKRIAMRVLAGVTRRREAEAEVQQLLNSTAARARNIVTTEGTRDYNQGRLTQFQIGEVDHVMFRATLDQLTSVQCRTRHGLIMATNDSRLATNTPPLHGHCRSLLSPVLAKYEPGLMSESWRFDWSNTAALPKGWNP